MGRLDGKTAIVTGSGRGIGKAIALRFAREGADVVVDDIVAPNIEKTVAEIRALGRKAIGVEADVAKKVQVTQLIKTAIDAFKRVDILVNNAGISRHGPFLELTEADWDAVLDVDLKAVFLCTQAAAPQMIKQKYGKIINIASIAGLGGAGDTTMANYASAKAGVVNLTKITAKALGQYGINVNAIAPGMIATEFTRTRRTQAELEEFLEGRRRMSVLGKTGTPDDIANLALFLASDEASFITGQVISCDGGRPVKL